MLIKFVILSMTMRCSLLTVITIINFAFLFFPFLLNVLGSSSLVSQVNQNPFSYNNNNNNTLFRFQKNNITSIDKRKLA